MALSFGAAVFITAAAGVGVAHEQAPSRTTSAATILYASAGPRLTRYDVDVEKATLTARESISVPANVQYVWPHPSRRHVYVVWSGGGGAERHGVSAFDVDSSGALKPHGEPVTLQYRPIHVTLDRDGRHLLVAYNVPPLITVHNIAADGSIGAAVPQTAKLEFGIYPHQVRVEPSTGTVMLVARGNYSPEAKTTDPGAIDLFGFANGQLSPRGVIAPNGGNGFNPRHLDFHPSKPWVFVSLEGQNQLQTFRLAKDGALEPTPLFTKPSLVTPADVRVAHRQLAGTVHVHSNGRFVYQANRGTGTVEAEGKRVWAGGSNSIAVFRIDQTTGEPTLVQNAETHGQVPRTFALDPSGRLLVAANQNPMLVREGDRLTMVPASLAVFRVRDDGRLDYVSKVDIEGKAGENMFWMGMMAAPRP